MNVFRFKQFAVDQQDCAMKINTDGVLLGAMAIGQEKGNILDIGTGTGVIALMMAQRYGQASLTGVELDHASAERARQNAAESPFADRVSIVHSAFQDFLPPGPVDLLVSNPPFYTDSLRNPDNRKGQARHTDRQFFADLLRYAEKHLSNRGAIELVLPTSLADEVATMAVGYGLYLTNVTRVSSFEDSEVIRQIVRFERQEPPKVVNQTFVIYEAKGQYSQQYKETLKPFFLAF